MTAAVLALDTNVLIELLRGRRPVVRERFGAALAAGRGLVTSLIVLHELVFGCERSADPVGQRQRVRALLGPMAIEPLDEADVCYAARLRAILADRDQPIGAYDVLIAGQAMARGWTLVTANIDEFRRVEGLNLIDWTARAD